MTLSVDEFPRYGRRLASGVLVMSIKRPLDEPGDWAGPAEMEDAGTTASELETRFERARRTVGLALGPAAFAVCWLMPLEALKPEAHRLAAVMSLVVVWWITEAIPIPVTALVGAALAVACGVANATETFAPFASPTIFLFIGSFIIGQGIAKHELDRRLALNLLSLPFVQGNVTRMRVAIGLLCLIVSAWMSNTATAAMMLPVACGVLASAGLSQRPGGRACASGMLLTVAYAASIGGIITPVGTPPNLITLELLKTLAGVEINFLTWMLMMMPIAATCCTAMFLAGSWLFPVPKTRTTLVTQVDSRECVCDQAGSATQTSAAVCPAQASEDATAVRAPWTTGQRNCAIAFGMAVTLWVTPGALVACGWGDRPSVNLLASRLDESVVAVLAAASLFLLPVNWRERRFTIDWHDAARIDWGTILLFGGGLSLGRLMFLTGLAEHIGKTVAAWSGVETLWGITAMTAVLGILLTEITSNTAATNMLVPVAISIAQASGVSPVAPALAACLGASMAFMLPVSTPPNAIVYGSGLVPVTAMLRFGIVLDALSVIIIVAGLRVLLPLFGLT